MPVAGPVLPDNLETRPKNQMVLSINIKDLRELSKEMGKNGTSKLLERDDELYETKDPHQQAQLLQRRRRRQKP